MAFLKRNLFSLFTGRGGLHVVYGKIVGLAVFVMGKDIVAFPDGKILICRAIESGRDEVTGLFCSLHRQIMKTKP